MKKNLIALLAAALTAVSVNAQSADFITQLLNTDKATAGQVCYLFYSAVSPVQSFSSTVQQEAAYDTTENDTATDESDAVLSITSFEKEFSEDDVNSTPVDSVNSITESTSVPLNESADFDISSAYEWMKQNNYISSSVRMMDSISYAGLANLISKTWNIKLSLMYRIFPCDRYAFKQLKALGLLPPSASPFHKPSGKEVLDTVTLCLDAFGNPDEKEELK